MKQKPGMTILTYSKEVEALQNTIIEQKTLGCTPGVAQALERSIKRQTLQVFVEGLGDLRKYIKARNPDSLFNAIQTAREKEIVRKSFEESNNYISLQDHQKPNQDYALFVKNLGTGLEIVDMRQQKIRSITVLDLCTSRYSWHCYLPILQETRAYKRSIPKIKKCTVKEK